MSTPGKLIVAERDRPSHFPTPANASGADAMIAMIDRASRDPSVDMDKFERLIAIRNQIIESEKEAAFNDAMSDAQREMSPISADAYNSQTKSKYATYAQLDLALRPIYTKHGFALSFDEGESPKPDHVRVLCYVTCKGFKRVYKKDMSADGKGAKGGDVMTKTHASGAAQSYGQRYILKGVFNVAVGEDDNDGNAEPETIGPGQLKELEQLITDVGADKTRFLAFLKVASLDKILVRSYETAKAALESKRKVKK